MKKQVPSSVIEALNHIRSLFPNVTTVFFSGRGHWLFMTDDNETPSFEGKDIDVSLLERAVDSVDELPFTHRLDVPFED